MARIRGKDTGPEIAVRKALHAAGFRFRLHDSRLPGRPDLVLPKWRSLIFVHGCFWHRHPDCRFAYTPKSRVDFWEGKFASNVARDARNEAEAERLGWHVIVIWECEATTPERIVATIKARLPPAAPGQAPQNPQRS